MMSTAESHVFNPLDVMTGVLIGLLLLFVFREFIVRPALDVYHAVLLKRQKRAYDTVDFIKNHARSNVSIKDDELPVAFLASEKEIELMREKALRDYQEVLKSHGLEECKRCKQHIVDIERQWCPLCDMGKTIKEGGSIEPPVQH